MRTRTEASGVSRCGSPHACAPCAPPYRGAGGRARARRGDRPGVAPRVLGPLVQLRLLLGLQPPRRGFVLPLALGVLPQLQPARGVLGELLLRGLLAPALLGHGALQPLLLGQPAVLRLQPLPLAPRGLGLGRPFRPLRCQRPQRLLVVARVRRLPAVSRLAGKTRGHGAGRENSIARRRSPGRRSAAYDEQRVLGLQKPGRQGALRAARSPDVYRTTGSAACHRTSTLSPRGRTGIRTAPPDDVLDDLGGGGQGPAGLGGANVRGAGRGGTGRHARSRTVAVQRPVSPKACGASFALGLPAYRLGRPTSRRRQRTRLQWIEWRLLLRLMQD